ncbi:MAG: PIN domain-containing protein [Deltaproteobacteria bacterium]
MKPVVYDAGVLIAADRSERHVWAAHRVWLESGSVPLVPAPVVAQVSRSPQQAELRRLLRGCEIVPFAAADAHDAGALLGKSRSRDVVDAAVVALAIGRRADIQSGDGKDIRRLLAAAGAKLRVLEV